MSEILSLMFPHSVDIKFPSHTTSAVTGTDVAAACAHLPKRSYAYLMYIYFDSENSGVELLRYLQKDIISSWKDRYAFLVNEKEQKQMSMQLALLAIHDVKHRKPHALCSGNGMKNGKICKSCNGTGFRGITTSNILKYLGISKSSFYRKWRDIYLDCYTILLRYPEGSEKIIKKQLYSC